MSAANAIRLFSLVALVCASMHTSCMYAQTAIEPDTVRFSIGLVPVSNVFDSLKQNVMRTLAQALMARGAIDTGTPEWLFTIGTKELPQDKSKRVIVTVTTLQVLPKEAIDAGKQKEVFYSNLPTDKKATLPSEGKWVREMVSAEMLQQFGMPLDQEIIVAERGTMKKELSRFVDEFYEKYVRAKK